LAKAQDRRSPLKRQRTGTAAPPRVSFEDERGGDLEKEIPRVAPKTEKPRTAEKDEKGPIAQARSQIPRREGETRAQWKNRIFEHLRKSGKK